MWISHRSTIASPVLSTCRAEKTCLHSLGQERTSSAYEFRAASLRTRLFRPNPPPLYLLLPEHYRLACLLFQGGIALCQTLRISTYSLLPPCCCLLCQALTWQSSPATRSPTAGELASRQHSE